jgi:hypothetical protein
MKKLLAAMALVFMQAGLAPAATMTFDNLGSAVSDNFLTKTYKEDGITGTGNGFLFDSLLRSADSLYMADGGYGGPTRMIFTMTSAFNAISFDLTPSIFSFFVTNTQSGKSKLSSFVNVRVEGFDADGLRAVTSFNMGTVQTATTYLLGAAFANLTSLVIGFEPIPGFGVPVAVGPNKVGQCTDVPCSRYRIDNVTLAPVPLPASVLLMLSALAGLGFAARRRLA